jgi:hypothetical protein
MNYDVEIYRLATLLLRKYGTSAPLLAAKRVEEEEETGDVLTELVWKALLRTMHEYVRTVCRADERVN